MKRQQQHYHSKESNTSSSSAVCHNKSYQSFLLLYKAKRRQKTWTRTLFCSVFLAVVMASPTFHFLCHNFRQDYAVFDGQHPLTLLNVRSSTRTKSTNTTNLSIAPQQFPSMSACIFVRNDNQLLSEWVAYHYTVLPLRRLIVACDENVTEDPHDVLRPWKVLGLDYEVWQAVNYTQNITYDYYHPLHRFRRRQPFFISKCLKHLYHTSGNQRGWVALVDTDEYIKLNPLEDALNDKIYDPESDYQPTARLLNDTWRYMVPNETIWDRITMRKQLRQRLGLEKAKGDRGENSSFHSSGYSIPTVLEILEEYSAKHGTQACHPISRLRFSAVTENATALSEQLCRPQLRSFVKESFNASKLNTIRFLYHADSQGWKHNEWAKALVDLRRIPLDSLQQVANPHQPLRECAGPQVHDLISFIHANHYVLDWNVFGGRKGDTRARKVADWAKFAHVRDGARCDHMHAWLNQFVERFGMIKAKQLLRHALEY